MSGTGAPRRPALKCSRGDHPTDRPPTKANQGVGLECERHANAKLFPCGKCGRNYSTLDYGATAAFARDEHLRVCNGIPPKDAPPKRLPPKSPVPARKK